MFIDNLHNLNKCISYLCKHFNQHGKYRQKRKLETAEVILEKGNNIFPYERALCVLCNKMGFLWNLREKKDTF